MRLNKNCVLLALATAPCLCQTPAATLQSVTGHQFILRNIGEFSKSKLKKSELANLKGNCDIAVVVTDADWRSGTVSLKIRNIGMPHVSGQRPSTCPSAKESTALQISGFATDEPPDAVVTALRQFLQTPEEYLAAKGIAFSIPPGPDDEDALKLGPPMVPPKILLQVEGAYTGAARSARLSGTVVVSLVVGTDGRAHHARIIHGPGLGLEESALQVLPLWRFEPARRQDQPVAVRSNVQMNFRLL
jgi:TonB family protein